MKIFLALLIGFAVSYFFSLPQITYNLVEKAATIGLIFLLFIMGIQVGMNDEVMSNLPTIGWKAVVLALGTVVGSTIFVFILEKIFAGNQRLDKELNQ